MSSFKLTINNKTHAVDVGPEMPLLRKCSLCRHRQEDPPDAI